MKRCLSWQTPEGWMLLPSSLSRILTPSSALGYRCYTYWQGCLIGIGGVYANAVPKAGRHGLSLVDVCLSGHGRN